MLIVELNVAFDAQHQALYLPIRARLQTAIEGGSGEIGLIADDIIVAEPHRPGGVAGT
jgi:hypothetical protein